jgi:hypothetical protein
MQQLRLACAIRRTNCSNHMNSIFCKNGLALKTLQKPGMRTGRGMCEPMQMRICKHIAMAYESSLGALQRATASQRFRVALSYGLVRSRILPIQL